MAPYIFAEKKGIHVIDLNKTIVKLDDAAAAMKQMARSGKKILFVATKKQAKDLVAAKVKPTGMPYVTERWSGGMLTNFGTIRKAIRKMASIDKMATDGTFDNISKRERLQIMRQREKLEKNLGTISELTRLPAAVFVVDILKEHIAIAEAKKLNIPTFAMVDTNSDPTKVDFPIPANDDATKSIETVMDVLIGAINEGLNDRKLEKDKKDADKKAAADAAAEAKAKAEEAKAAAKAAAAEEAPAEKKAVKVAEAAPSEKAEK